MELRKKSFIGVALIGIAIVITIGVQRQSKLLRGEELAGLYCSTCHLEPSPEILPKRSWAAALGYMGYFLGIENTQYLDDEPAFVQANVRSRQEFLQNENSFPAAPVLDDGDWEALRYYYIENSPENALPQFNKPPLQWELPRFRSLGSSYRPPQAVTTMVHIREDTNEIYIGDSELNALTVLDQDGRIRVLLRRFRPEITPVDIEFINGTAYAASIGDLLAEEASDTRPGSVSTIELVDQSIADATATMTLDNLYRVADMEIADLNGDGLNDFVIAGFGAIDGRVSWFESQGDGSYEEHVLLGLPGAVKIETHDFNNDDRLDVMVLVSDAREGLHLFINQGNNQFSAQPIFETHSGYGHSFFELQDFDGDGAMDVLVVNGDNVDSDPYNTLKNYHGLRIYLNRGDSRFEEAYFYPLYGAFIAKSADFDNDGDLDIAAISFYPDFSSDQREAFTYLENQGGLEFAAFTNEDAMRGRWMTMDVGDVDGDNDVDVVLGGSYLRVGMFAYPEIYDELSQRGPAVLILKNTLN
ncbi:MAG: VCBS repeat-containing protein [Pseudomonadota bacterium]|nr:VCBS repeat-containing protein [Pseudomonadota bacterium]